MQIFTCEWDLKKNAARLDNKRIFKQLLEGKQILDILVNKKTGGWSNHPSTNQWRGHEGCLFIYLTMIWRELQSRKIAVNSKLYLECSKLVLKLYSKRLGAETNNPPEWWGRADILKSHRSRLKCKGLIDIYCAAIKKHFKIKNLDEWLKKNFRKSKNQLRYSDAKKLEEIINLEEISHYTGDSANPIIKIDKNHYDIKEWSKIPYDLDYIWPAQSK